jgi:hypothetical protein
LVAKKEDGTKEGDAQDFARACSLKEDCRSLLERATEEVVARALIFNGLQKNL